MNETNSIVVIEEEQDEEEIPSLTPVKDHLEDVTIPKTQASTSKSMDQLRISRNPPYPERLALEKREVHS